MVAYSPRNVAFSKVLYVVPTRDDEGNLIAGAEIVPGVLNGNTAVAQATSGDNTGSVMGIDTLANVGATASRTAGTYDIADSSGNGTTACVAVVVVAADGSATVTISEAGAGYSDADALTFARTDTYAGATNITAAVDGVSTGGGVSTYQRFFVPVTDGRSVDQQTDAATGTGDGGGIDYGNNAQNMAGDREQTRKMVGVNRDSDDSGNVADEDIGYAVYGETV